MGGNQAMIVAGIGCRRGCPAEGIVALVREAGAVDLLAAPDWKRDEAGLLEAARALGLPLVFVGETSLAAVQPRCVTQSAVVSRSVGLASVAEAAALAGGGTLLRPRFGAGWATCATATYPPPSFMGEVAAKPTEGARDPVPAPGGPAWDPNPLHHAAHGPPPPQAGGG